MTPDRRTAAARKPLWPETDGIEDDTYETASAGGRVARGRSAVGTGAARAGSVRGRHAVAAGARLWRLRHGQGLQRRHVEERSALLPGRGRARTLVDDHD